MCSVHLPVSRSGADECWCCVAAATLTAQYNNLENVKEVFAANKGEIAGIILEPVVGNSGYIEPTKEFLQASHHQITKAS